MPLKTYLPILAWGRTYTRTELTSDVVAAVIVTTMLIPQSLAYAMLAGLPAQFGLYASILPLIVYAVFGTSRTLAVGPVAILSLMTAAAAANVASPGSGAYIEAAIVLALLSGALLFVCGLFRMGFLANFLSHPVISAFITASGVLIAVSQLKHVLGIDAHGHNLVEIFSSLAHGLQRANVPTALIGFGTLALLFLMRARGQALLVRFGVGESTATIVNRTGPVVAVIASIVIVAAFDLDKAGVRILAEVPRALPAFGIPHFDFAVWRQLLGSAALIALIGFVESVSVAQTLAAKKRQRVDPNQELIAMGLANLSAGASSGFPVTGGLSRSAVNFDAGAASPAAGAFTAVGIALASLFLTPYLYYLPQAVLAATIIVAVLSLVDVRAIRTVWAYSKSDFAAMAATILVTLGSGIELGVTTGVALSLFLHLYNTSRPHFAIVGQVPGTQYFRNVNRHAVAVPDHVLTLRVDESLYFANARFLEDTVYALLGQRPDLTDLILQCPAVNRIDASGLESLEAINLRLGDAGVRLHLSEVKGPVMDRLKHTHFLANLGGKVYFNQFEAIADLDPACATAAVAGTASTTNPASDPPPSVVLAGLQPPLH